MYLTEKLEREVRGLKQERQSTAVITPSSGIQSTPGENATSTLRSSIVSTESLTSIPSITQGSARAEAVAAIDDLVSLPREFLSTLAELWFKENQPWCPILNPDQIRTALADLPDPVDHIPDVVLRAVISMQIAYSSAAISLGYRGRRRLSLHLRSEVLSEALTNFTLSSLQALLVTAILDYGSDDISSTFSLMAVCRRKCEQLGLFRKLLSHIEDQNPSHVGPPARDAFGGAELALPLSWATLALDATSSLGITWRDASAALVDHLSSIAYTSIHNYRDSFRQHVHLCAIGLQPLHQFINEHEKGRYALGPQEALDVCDEIYQNFMTYIHSQPTQTYSLLADGAIDFDVNTVLTYILAYCAIILLYSRLCTFNTGVTDIPEHRSLQAYEGLVTTMRNISDADAELNSPLMSSFLFLALRLKLVQYRKLSQPREASFDILMHSLNMCGRRWPIARRADLVLRAAVLEVDTGMSTPLPAVFWDLRKSHLEISEETKEWIMQYRPSLFVGSLNGAYV